MCGIAGIWQRGGKPIDEGALQRMEDLLRHRGPDGFGRYVAGEIGLANRRLRILDLSAAADQPLSLPGGRLWLTFNGEIHNYLELRRELQSRGAAFRTGSDTEVVLWAYATWGAECFERFNGMWAIALWDPGEQRLVLSRDRFGIKPLCYSVRGQRVCFASEPKAILAAFPEERRAHVHEIERFAGGAYPDTGADTFFENVHNVRPGTSMVFSPDGVHSEDYWRFEPGLELARPDAEAEFRELLTDAVRLRTRSDVPLGACLSGGLDSSAVVSLVDLPDGGPLQCFSTRYDEAAYDESHYAELVAKRYGVAVHWVRPDPTDMLETMRRIVWHHDAPAPLRGRFGEWFVMREAARHVHVVLAGQGADELLAGYGRDTVPYLIDRVRTDRIIRPSLIREAAELGKVGSSLHWFLLTAVRRHRHDPRMLGERPYRSTLNNVLWDELRHHGLPESLHNNDALSMAFSVESRAPFLDHRLVEFCFSLPFDEKIAGGWTKSLLRRSMAGTLPTEVLARRRKFGFQAPILPWLRRPDNFRAVRELLLDARSVNRGIFEPRRLELELSAFQRAPSRYARTRLDRVWRSVTLELWFRQFLDGPAPRGDGRSAGAEPSRGSALDDAHLATLRTSDLVHKDDTSRGTGPKPTDELIH